jgi:hypothetical protein
LICHKIASLRGQFQTDPLPPQLSTDGHRIYEGTVGPSFANNVDWAPILKHYATAPELGKYSPPACTGTKRRVLIARPHATLKERYPRTPAMAAGVADHIWSLEEIAALLD